MTRLIFLTAAIMTAINFVLGYAVQFLTSVIAMSFDLPGPLSTEPIAWLWFVVSLILVFGVSIAFCRWFARRVTQRTDIETTFE